jgi:hypothetical protein
LRKINFILIILILNFGCAVKKKNSKSVGSDIAAPEERIYADLLNQNLTGKSFFIERAEFKIHSGFGEKSGLGTVKFLKPDKFLISIKSIVGIEVARIFLKGDSIFINDRFNKKIYYGSASYLKSKYGVSTSLLPVLLGDYVNDQKPEKKKINCVDGKFSILGIIDNIHVKYKIDCELGKIIWASQEDMREESTLQIKYSEFFSSNGINTPGKIEIIEGKTNTTIEIYIKKMISPWDGVIDFIPGKQYDKIHLQ